MINRTPVYKLPMPEENDNYSLSIVNEVTQKTEDALVAVSTQLEEKANTKGYINSGNIFDIADSLEASTTTFGVTDAVTGLPQIGYYSSNLWLSASKRDGTLIVKDISRRLIHFSNKENGIWSAWEDVAIQKRGTWTPALQGLDETGEFVYTTRQGIYCRVGNIVSIACDIAIGEVIAQPIGGAVISGIPFAAAMSGASSISCGYMRGGKDESLRKFCNGNIEGNGKIYMRCHEIVNGSSLLTAIDFDKSNTTGNRAVLPVGATDSIIQFSACYGI